MIVKRWYVIIVLSALLIGQVKGPIVARAASLSQDGVIPSYRNQLWRLSGRLSARGGETFSYAAIFFRYAEPNDAVIYSANLSVLDESNSQFLSERRTERAGLGLADATTGRLAVHIGTWRLSQSSLTSEVPTFDLNATVDGVELFVHGTARKPRFVLKSVIAEHDGYSSIASNGTISISGRRLEVYGKSWLDHELSNTTPSANAPVAQYRVQLDDGREIYVETMGSGKAETPRRRAYLVERDGTIDTLLASSYEFGEHPGSTWLSPHTRAIYPNIWGLHVDGKTEYLSLEPMKYDQESLANGNGLSYWDGAVDIYDVTPGSQGLRLGSGSVLMYGYSLARSKS